MGSCGTAQLEKTHRNDEDAARFQFAVQYNGVPKLGIDAGGASRLDISGEAHDHRVGFLHRVADFVSPKRTGNNLTIPPNALARIPEVLHETADDRAVIAAVGQEDVLFGHAKLRGRQRRSQDLFYASSSAEAFRHYSRASRGASVSDVERCIRHSCSEIPLRQDRSVDAKGCSRQLWIDAGRPRIDQSLSGRFEPRRPTSDIATTQPSDFSEDDCWLAPSEMQRSGCRAGLP